MTDTTPLRERFEHWMLNVAKCAVGSSDPYPAGLERDYWKAFQAGALAARDEAGDRFMWADLPWRAATGWLRSASGSKIAEVGEHDGCISQRESELIAAAVNAYTAAPSPASRARPEAQGEAFGYAMEYPHAMPTTAYIHAPEFVKRLARAEQLRDGCEREYGEPAKITPVYTAPPADRAPGEVGGAEELALWLDAKYRRHGEEEDDRAAKLIRRLAARAPSAQGEKESVRQDTHAGHSADRVDDREPGRVIPGTDLQDVMVEAEPFEMAEALAEISAALGCDNNLDDMLEAIQRLTSAPAAGDGRPSDAAIAREFWKRWTSTALHVEAAHELQRLHDAALTHQEPAR